MFALSLIIIFETRDYENRLYFSKIYSYPKKTYKSNTKDKYSQGLLRHHPKPREALYIAIIDQSYHPEPYQCLMYHQLVQNFTNEFTEIDNVEFYSLNDYSHPNCSLRTSTVPPPPGDLNLIDPSSWLVKEVLESYIYRSDAQFLFLVNDAAYIHKPKLINFFKEYSNKYNPMKIPLILGNCIERAYFFRYNSIDSGVLLSRRAVLDILKEDDKWNVTIILGVKGQEALAHVAASTGMYVPYPSVPNFIGTSFLNELDLKRMRSKNFTNLPKCEIPNKILDPDPGMNGVCIKFPQKMNEVLSWAGGGYTPESKAIFLNEAQQLLENVPDYVGYVFHKLWIRLCNYELK